MNGIAGNVILTEEQKSFLIAFRDCPFRDQYYLSGGTAIAAFYLNHRFSEDLDFLGIRLTPMATTGCVALTGLIRFRR